MADSSWKVWERVVAGIFGGRRRGPDPGGADGGKSDVVHPYWSIEAKLLSRPGYSDLVEGCRQSERNARPGQEPVLVIRRKRDRVDDALVVQRLAVFRERRLGNRAQVVRVPREQVVAQCGSLPPEQIVAQLGTLAAQGIVHIVDDGDRDG